MKYAAALVAAAGLAGAQSTTKPSASAGPTAAPYPNAYYPGYADPAISAGAKSGQTSPPKYPSPWMNGQGAWAAAYAQAQAFVKDLTLVEKVNITTGVGWELEQCVGQTGSVPRLGFRSLCLQDSPLGVRDTDYNTGFPAGGFVAASWNRSLWYQRGYDMGSEHRDKGVDMQLGPVVGPLGRNPEGGRGWEGFSPDPVLSGIAVAETVKGIQDAGVIACTKHFIGNEQEHFRQFPEAQGYGFNISASYSSNIDDITMHELYLWPFADAVRAGTGSVMCSYNQINNSYACQNSYTQNYLLKGELGFQGFIVSDWAGTQGGIESVLAGLDMTMPGDVTFDSKTSYLGANLTIAVLNGTVPEWRIDDMVTRIVAAWYYAGRESHQVPINFDSWTLDTYGYQHYFADEGYTQINQHVNVQGDHAADVRIMASQSTVLLKNKGALPLSNTEQFTAVFGEDAGPNMYGPNGCGDRGCDNGTMAMGWGSGTANFPFLVTPMQAIENEVINNGNGVVQSIIDDWAYDQIGALAAQASVALVFVNSDSGEGYINVDGNEGDRNNLTLWRNGETLIQNVTALCNNTIVVIHSTGPIIVQDWYDHENVTAILWGGVPGEQSGNAIVDVLYGYVNPGGKLPFTMGAARQDYGTDVLYKPNNGNGAPQVDFAEGVFIDYRAFDKKNTTPIYEFGFGMSYTTFSYSGLQVIPQTVAPYTPASGNTDPAPTLGQPGSPSDAVYPSGFHRVPYYIYPYINSTNLKKSSGETDYGHASGSYLPAGFNDSSAQPIHPAGGAPGGNPQLYDVLYQVSATITNTGSVEGDEVVQMYISLGGPDDPVKVLRGFDRFTIAPGATATFMANITRRDVSNWSPAQQNWYISNHAKTVYVGASSRNLALQAPLPPPTYSGSGTTSPVSSYATPTTPMSYSTPSPMSTYATMSPTSGSSASTYSMN